MRILIVTNYNIKLWREWDTDAEYFGHRKAINSHFLNGYCSLRLALWLREVATSS